MTGWALKLIDSAQMLASDAVSKTILLDFIDGKILADSPLLLETLTEVIHGRWLLANPPVVAQVAPVIDAEDGKIVRDMNRELYAVDNYTSTSYNKERLTKCIECDTTVSTLAEHVHHRQCSRCGGYILDCEVGNTQMSSSSSSIYHSNIDTCLFHLNFVNLHQKKELSEIDRMKLLCEMTDEDGNTFCMICAAPTTDLWDSGKGHGVVDLKNRKYISLCRNNLYLDNCHSNRLNSRSSSNIMMNKNYAGNLSRKNLPEL
jgi:ribosomal protein S27AE